ncbi:hypothetical protein E2C01_018832 [Portunus trituberculatus]|uniref:Uncharacterized protein n=1 Tax=Portunus trituberculatus TaxID=210409 RepID=A0A5B7DW34_PORTR|nr:hypothetical protein [Portunus trituberculatus]
MEYGAVSWVRLSADEPPGSLQMNPKHVPRREQQGLTDTGPRPTVLGCTLGLPQRHVVARRPTLTLLASLCPSRLIRGCRALHIKLECALIICASPPQLTARPSPSPSHPFITLLQSRPRRQKSGN